MNKRNIPVNDSEFQMALPTAISHAQTDALQRIDRGKDLSTVKNKFFCKAKTLILESMHNFKKELSSNEPNFNFTHNAYHRFSLDKNQEISVKLGSLPLAPHPSKLSAHYSLTMPEITPGAHFTMPKFIPCPQLPCTNILENSGPEFVVYFGQDSKSGFFHHYSNSGHELDTKSIAPASFHVHLIKSFPTVQAAQSTYQECMHTGVLVLLRVQESQNMVKNALTYGLNWQGGKVTCTDGAVANAKAIFDYWNSLGQVTCLHWDQPFNLDAFFKI
ncbi:hypothetical protein BT96DRAFT_950698 [Gymnopus androsaceus JB14]|uniref:Uncharacterized protein n=1 Tax=Gymnopus androsaceus JB14 TaxID=1447944 RepID=A0A6A4GG12_9AGAR|nr:hypothetical protein BT96DRAFT_950698 [Gymnopus androsaceus JB14]